MKGHANIDADLMPFLGMALGAFCAGIGIFMAILWLVARLTAA